MSPLLITATIIVWLGCGAWAVRIDTTEFPEAVVPGADELLRLVLFFGGPAALGAILLMRRGQ